MKHFNIQFLRWDKWVYFLCILLGSPFTGAAVSRGNPKAPLYVIEKLDRIVKGTVRDSIGPLAGVTVSLKSNPKVSVSTNQDGGFSLKVPDNAVLVFSMLGYRTYEETVRGREKIEVVMHVENNALDEVVVVGFGVQKKINLTGAVGTATAKDLESRPVVNATQALQGIVPGLQITTNTGELDKSMSINVRGQGTIGQGSSGSPLILIDGMEGDINTVNPQDIQSISVLKDAASSSIYGSRAPFGVILVTTKTGKSGKMSINYNNSFRVSDPINLAESMNSYVFANYFNSASKNSGWGTVFTDEVMQKMLDFQAAGGSDRGALPTDGNVWGKPAGDPYTTAYANTDWLHELYKDNNTSQDHNLSMSGGNDKTSYYASLGYLDQAGTLRYGDDGLKRYNVSGKINSKLKSWLDFSYAVRFIRTDNWCPSSYNDGIYASIGRQSWPNLPVYDENGYFHDSNGSTPAMRLAEGGQRNVQSDQYYHQGTFIVEPVKNWKTNFNLNYSTYSSGAREVNLPVYNHDVAGNVVDTHGTSSLYVDNTKENFLNINIFSEYSRSFNSVHNFKIMGGFQTEEMKQSFFSAKAYGLLVDDIQELNATSSTDGTGLTKVDEAGGYRNEWANEGFFGRLNYNYKGKYLLELNMRYDGSSRFRSGSRWNASPSVSAGWNISEEEFWKPLAHVVNNLKIRGSYGELGNQNTSSWYPTYRTMTITSAGGGWLQNGVNPNVASIGGLISTSLSWEKIRSWNAGLDWGMINDRLTGSFDIYTRYTDNMVGPAPALPSTLGVGAPSTNNCDLKTQGWELQVGWNDRLQQGFGYGVKVVLADAISTVESYPSNTTNTLSNYYAGKKIGEIWGYETVGIAKTQAEMDAHLEKVGGQPFGSEWAAGDIMYADLDGKPGITSGANTLEDHGDLKVIGNSTPRYQFGVDLTANWKGFDFRAFFQGVMKRDIWSSGNMFWGVVANQWISTGYKEHNDYFRAEAIGLDGHLIEANTDAYYPRPLFNSSKNQQVQTRYLQDASYIRLKNLQIGYSLPSALMRKVSVTKCRLFLSGENLWTGTKLSKLFDPETVDGGNTSESSSWLKGAGNAYPLSRVLSLGVSLTL